MKVYGLPPDFVESGLELAKGARLFGKSFDDMTREELIAAAAHGWDEGRRHRESRYEESKALAALYAKFAHAYVK